MFTKLLRYPFFCSLFLFTFASQMPDADAATLRVTKGGAGLTLPAAARQARDGDVILIDPGTYASCARFRANRLTIRASVPPNHRGPTVTVKGPACDGKAHFVIVGDAVEVSGIAFSGARVPDGNGAGIRSEGGQLTISDCHFRNNEMGVLTTNKASAVLIVKNSRFANNGRRAGRIGHAVYAGRIAQLSVVDSVFETHIRGHHIKSRARTTQVVGNQIGNTGADEASYIIDLPDGGGATIKDNMLFKGRKSQNRGTAIAIGFERNRNPAGEILVANNDFENRAGANTVFVKNRTPIEVVLSGNRFVGPMRILRGNGVRKESKRRN
ncbi:MAG: hypothetical protein AAGF15_09370 [Pseudomonadota bacterium]